MYMYISKCFPGTRHRRRDIVPPITIYILSILYLFLYYQHCSKYILFTNTTKIPPYKFCGYTYTYYVYVFLVYCTWKQPPGTPLVHPQYMYPPWRTAVIPSTLSQSLCLVFSTIHLQLLPLFPLFTYSSGTLVCYMILYTHPMYIYIARLEFRWTQCIYMCVYVFIVEWEE